MVNAMTSNDDSSNKTLYGRDDQGAKTAGMQIQESERNKKAHPFYEGALYQVHENTPFLFKEGESNELVVFFHGSIQAKAERSAKTPLPVFFGINRKFAGNPHLLHFSDGLLERYKDDGLELGWFLDSKKFKQQAAISDAVRFYRDKYSVKNIIFHGSSGGGYISLLMASLFQETAVVANSQFYLERHGQYKDLADIMQKNADELLVHDIMEVLQNLPKPKKVHNFCNTDDSTVRHHKPVMEWIENRAPRTVVDHWFSGNSVAKARGVRNHAVRFPEGTTLETAINGVLSECRA